MAKLMVGQRAELVSLAHLGDVFARGVAALGFGRVGEWTDMGCWGRCVEGSL